MSASNTSPPLSLFKLKHRGFPSGLLVFTASLRRVGYGRRQAFYNESCQFHTAPCCGQPNGCLSSSVSQVPPQIETHSPNAKLDLCPCLHQLFTGLLLCVQRGSGDTSMNQIERPRPRGVMRGSFTDTQPNQQGRNFRERDVC